MKNSDKYFDLINKDRDKLSSEEMETLRSELGNLDQFDHLMGQVEAELNNEEFEPSANVKFSLDQAFEKRAQENTARKNGIFSLQAFQSSSPLRFMATAASMTIVLFLSVQMGFNNQPGDEYGGPILADSIHTGAIVDSGQVQVDSAFIHWQ